MRFPRNRKHSYEKSNVNANVASRLESADSSVVLLLVSIESIESTGDITVASQFVGLLLCAVSSYHREIFPV